MFSESRKQPAFLHQHFNRSQVYHKQDAATFDPALAISIICSELLEASSFAIFASAVLIARSSLVGTRNTDKIASLPENKQQIIINSFQQARGLI